MTFFWLVKKIAIEMVYSSNQIVLSYLTPKIGETSILLVW